MAGPIAGLPGAAGRGIGSRSRGRRSGPNDGRYDRGRDTIGVNGRRGKGQERPVAAAGLTDGGPKNVRRPNMRKPTVVVGGIHTVFLSTGVALDEATSTA